MRCGAAVEPETGRAAHFDLAAGGVLCAPCALHALTEAGAPMRIQAETLRFLRAIMKQGLDLIGEDLPMPDEALVLLRRYVELRTERTVRSGKLLS